MLFNSAEFLFLFLPVTLVGYYWIRHTSASLSVLWLLAASLLFYAAWNPKFIVVLLSSIGFNYALAYLIQIRRRERRYILIAGVAANLLILGYFKYTNFFVDTLNDIGVDATWREVVLPIGISFFTFQQIAYLVDTYSGRFVERSFTRYILFIAFFPQLIAGPIVHHREMMPQFSEPQRNVWDDVAVGATFLAIGLVKKVIIADSIAIPASAPFSGVAAGEALTFIEAWTAATCYALQIYFDFSAYSDMAVGLGRMFGIDLPINFASPYKAKSIAEFWRRWHITLSRFLRDYLYIPLGGSRGGPSRTQINLFLTMLLGGIWHGAGWTFAIWGALHGIYLLVHRVWTKSRHSEPLRTSVAWRPVAWTLTIVAVIIAWVPFRAVDMPTTVAFWTAMATPDLTAAGTLLDLGEVFPLAAALLAICVFMPNAYELFAHKSVGLASQGYPATDVQNAVTPRWAFGRVHAVVLGCAFGIVILNLWNISEFIYFQF